ASGGPSVAILQHRISDCVYISQMNLLQRGDVIIQTQHHWYPNATILKFFSREFCQLNRA
ncbi:hypothetical protein L9F63_023693, partial [Diploptera punctata]